MMRKPRIAVCMLALAMALWAARPVALADGIAWLTPGDVPEAGETMPEPGEEPSAGSESPWLVPDSAAGDEGSGPDRVTGSDEGSALRWLTADENSGETQDRDPVPEDGLKWLTPGETSAVVEEPEPDEDEPEWLTPDDAAVVRETPEPEPDEDEPEWLTPDKAPDDEEVSAPEEPEEETWLTLDQPSEPEEAEPEETEPEETEPEEENKPALDSGALIEVTVPVSGEMVINPHRFPVTLGGREIRDQIINVPQFLTNRSDVPIIVTASVTVDTGDSGGVIVTGHPIDKGETDKLAFLYVEFQNVADSEKEASWSGGYTGTSNQLLASGSGTVTGDVLRVEAGDKIPAYASYRLFGSLTQNPETGWQAGDRLSVTVSFTFRPAEEAEPEEEAETAEEPVETAAEPEEIPEMEDKADAKPEEVPVIAAEPEPEPDPGPEPEPEPEGLEIPAYEPAAVFEPETPEEKEIEYFATATNSNWMAPPDET